MTKRNLPKIETRAHPEWLHLYTSPNALTRWEPDVQASSVDDATTISMYDIIGEDPWTGGGITARLVSGILRNVSDKPVVVNINSPGGDLFEGIAIYNVLRAHAGEVTVRVMGIAASAASLIAMAGDKIQIARAGFLMMHNCWVQATGNRHDLREFADWLEPFDASLANVYAARSGVKLKKVETMLNDETWINGEDSVKQGFADELLPADQVKTNARATERDEVKAIHRMDTLLASTGLSRTERRSLIAEVKSGKLGAAAVPPLTHNAEHQLDLLDFQQVIATMKG